MVAYLLVIGFFLLVASFAVAFVTTVQWGSPPHNLVGWMLFLSGVCYLLGWIAGGQMLLGAVTIIAAAILWWYLAPSLIPPKPHKDSEREGL